MVISNTNQIKKANTDAVRRTLRHGGGITIAEIVQATRLSVPTVSRIIDDMVSAGEVLNCPEEVATGGRRARQYRLNSAFSYILCVYFDRHQVWYTLCDAVGRAAEKGEIKVADYTHPDVIDQLVRTMQGEYPALRAVSIGVPAWVVNDELQVIHEYPGFDRIDFHALIERRYHLPCRVTNDLKAIAAGYYSSHFPDRRISLCCVYLSDSGPGAGLIVDGKLLPGVAGFAGEIGFLPAGDGRTVMEVLQSPKSTAAERVAAMAAASVALISLLNPDYLLFCTYGGRLPAVRDIVTACRRRLPEKALPQFIETADYHTYFLNGLRSIVTPLVVP